MQVSNVMTAPHIFSHNVFWDFFSQDSPSQNKRRKKQARINPDLSLRHPTETENQEDKQVFF